MQERLHNELGKLPINIISNYFPKFNINRKIKIKKLSFIILENPYFLNSYICID